MFTRYIRAPMALAKYEITEEDGTFYGSIAAPGFEGIWANASTLEACREELEEVLEDCVLSSVADHSPIPEIGGIRL
jgi:predicted RNase H-like HicB family nuclease